MAHTVGIDVGGTKVLSLVLDAAGNVSGEKRIPTPEGGDALIEAILSAIDAHRGEGPVDAVGVGVPGLVDRDGTLATAPNLPGVHALPIRARLVERTGLPVQVDNDATCAAWGERGLGAAKGSNDVIVVPLGTGIGGGIVDNGNLYRGAHGFAGEFGHMTV